mmetsp:Transcript_27771/g.29914  ORF Transcript_27771/g.29914 Transcript_27771/m.29914 type:complete len:348 (-) Transcript_27771:65-1108(-)
MGKIMSHHLLSAATILKEVNALIDNPTYSMKECNNISVQCTAVISYLLKSLPSKCTSSTNDFRTGKTSHAAKQLRAYHYICLRGKLVPARSVMLPPSNNDQVIEGMDPADGARRIFCVKEPVRWDVATKNGEGDRGLLSTFSCVSIRNLHVTIVVLLTIFTAPIIVDNFDDWNHFSYSLLTLVPQDLPSLWRIISFVFDWPAREVYRYGPSLVGWEGRDLVDICTQMNRRYYFVGLGRDGHHYEDREYWRQNSEACETIYRMKEESFARMCRPLWYLTALVVSFMAICQFLNAFFAKESDPQLNRIDRAVLDTYRALLMLSREHRRQEDRRHQQQSREEYRTVFELA